jgi:hypothetical protein
VDTAQLIRHALYTINGVLQNSTTDPYYRLPVLLAAATAGKNKVEKTVRAAKEDFALLTLASTDAAFVWCGVTYDPDVLQLVNGTRRYMLPPDLLLLKALRCLPDATDPVLFVHKDVSDPSFAQVQTGTTESEVIYFDVVGENTLLLNTDDVPGGTDVEITYIPRTGPLQLYSTGTVSLLNGHTAVSGAGTAWVAAGLRNNLNLIVSADGTAPKVVSQTAGGTWVDPSAEYYPVQSISADGTLTLASPWPLADAAGRGYVLATIPALPEEHHQAIAEYIAYAATKVRRPAAAQIFKADFGSELAEMRSDLQPRQEQSPVFVEDWEP